MQNSFRFVQCVEKAGESKMDRGLLVEKYEMQRKNLVEATDDIKEKIKKLEKECAELEKKKKDLHKKLEITGCKKTVRQKKEHDESKDIRKELIKYCSRCGNFVNGAQYCSKCGEKVN